MVAAMLFVDDVVMGPELALLKSPVCWFAAGCDAVRMRNGPAKSETLVFSCQEGDRSYLAATLRRDLLPGISQSLYMSEKKSGDSPLVSPGPVS